MRMDKLQAYETLSQCVQRLELAGKRLVTIKQLWELLKKRELARQQIGIWLRQQGFQKLGRRVKDKERSREWFLNEEAIGVIKKKNRKGFRCYNVDHVKKGQKVDFYYDLQADEELVDASMVVKVNDKDNWKICYCPICDRQDRRVYLNVTLDVKKLKNRVVFSARKVDPQGRLVDDRPGYHGPGMMEETELYKGKW